MSHLLRWKAGPQLKLHDSIVNATNHYLGEHKVLIILAEGVGNVHEIIFVVYQVIITVLQQNLVSLSTIFQVRKMAPFNDQLFEITDAAQVCMIVLLLIERHLLKVLEYVFQVGLLELCVLDRFSERVRDLTYLGINKLNAPKQVWIDQESIICKNWDGYHK